MPDTYSVSWMLNTMRGAPVINGNTPGCLIAALDAVLVTGWGAASPTTVTVSSGVATATFASATAWQVHAVIEVSGGTPSAINGKARVVTSSGNTLTWATSAADGTYTGSISIKYVSAGWEKVFSSGTTKAVYRSTDVSSSKLYLRVDDTGTHFARVRGYESMTDVDTGTGLFPTNTQMNGGGYWYKSYYNSNATAIPYLLVADSKTLLVAISQGVSYDSKSYQTSIRGFGDPISISPSGDFYGCFLSALGVNGYGTIGAAGLDGGNSPSGAEGFVVAARTRTGGGAVYQVPVPETGLLSSISGNCDYFGVAPSPIDGQVKHCRMLLKDQGTGEPVRSVVPGARFIPQTGAKALLDTAFELQTGTGDFLGRKLAVVHRDSTSYAVSVPGASLIDLTGPWR